MATPASTNGCSDGHILDERRRQPRLYQPLPITVLAATANLDLCTCCTRLDNLSAGGLYMRLPWPPVPGSPLIARLSIMALPQRRARHVAIGGEVLRVEPRLPSGYGTALRITWLHVI